MSRDKKSDHKSDKGRGDDQQAPSNSRVYAQQDPPSDPQFRGKTFSEITHIEHYSYGNPTDISVGSGGMSRRQSWEYIIPDKDDESLASKDQEKKGN
ncbi:hypothetical protein KJ359_001086 [Pestalotiopsis sp. 9143b]|nr:hypothetical protein KJ359_001086 [Pestalotiopsis sp. 9143b]